MLNISAISTYNFVEKLSEIVPVSSKHDLGLVSFEADDSLTGLMVNQASFPLANVLLMKR